MISIEKDGHKETDVMNDLLIIDWVTAVPESTVHFLEKICNMILQGKVTLLISQSLFNLPTIGLFAISSTLLNNWLRKKEIKQKFINFTQFLQSCFFPSTVINRLVDWVTEERLSVACDSSTGNSCLVFNCASQIYYRRA